MLTVNGKELDFDLTCPEDLRRYTAAGEHMEQAAAGVALPPKAMNTPADLERYIQYLEQTCLLIRVFLDEAFGEGTYQALAGPKESLEQLLDICEAIGAAVEEQSRRMDLKVRKFTPNRATRRVRS